MLAIYLVSLSKKLDEGVGGETRIVVVRDNGAWIDDPEYTKQFEIFIGEFLKLIDPLFLNCVDASIPPSSVFPDKLKEFGEKVTRLREIALIYSATHSLNRTFHDPNYHGEPYPKVFPGAITEVKGDGTVSVREDTLEELKERKKLFDAAKQDYNKLAGTQLQALITGRQVLYIGEEKIQVRGSAGPVPEPDKS